MKKIIYIATFFISISQAAFSQNVGIGLPNPSQLLHMKDGNLYVENGEIRLDNLGTKLRRSGANLSVEAQANLRLDPGSGYSIHILQNNIEYARFRGSTQRFGMGITNPEEKIDINGALRLSAAENANAGTIQWTGSDMQAHDGISWKSLIIPSSVKDADGDTEIVLTEGAQDEIKLVVDNKDIMKTTIWADGSHYIDWFGDTGAGAFQKIQHRFYNNGIVSGIVGTTNSAAKALNLTGDDKVTILGNYNDGAANAVYLESGKFFSTYGVGISKGGTVSGSLRALLDVRGDFECDGGVINEGIVINGGGTINGNITIQNLSTFNNSVTVNANVTITKVLNLTPGSEPNSPNAGDVYMDNGSCGDCNGVSLRYFNGSDWKTL